jgi:DNA adenine methylase
MERVRQRTLQGNSPVTGVNPKKLIQPIKWHGGKHYLAKWIVSLMPPHQHYVETHFGGGSVLLTRDPRRNWFEGHPNWTSAAAQLGCSEVVNDLNGDLMNFWRVLQDESQFRKLIRFLEATPFSKPQWEIARSDNTTEPVARAANFFIVVRQSMSARMNSFTPFSRTRTRGRRNGEVNAWWNCIEGLPAVRERLMDVAIYCEPAVQVIRREDTPNTLFYCDPPYLHETRSTTSEYGAFEMTEADHSELLGELARIQGKFLLSGYHSDLYDRWADSNGCYCSEYEIDNKSSSKKQKSKMVECVWSNFEPPAGSLSR